MKSEDGPDECGLSKSLMLTAALVGVAVAAGVRLGKDEVAGCMSENTSNLSYALPTDSKSAAGVGLLLVGSLVPIDRRSTLPPDLSPAITMTFLVAPVLIGCCCWSDGVGSRLIKLPVCSKPIMLLEAGLTRD